MPPSTVPTVCLVDRYEGVRTALRESLEARGAVRVVAEASGVAAARKAPGEVLVVGPLLSDGHPSDLLDEPRPVVAYTWLPADERRDVLPGRASVVHLDLVDGVAAAVKAFHTA